MSEYGIYILFDRLGECLGLLGVNGAGKTTTLKILTGETLMSEGAACVQGFDVETETKQVP